MSSQPCAPPEPVRTRRTTVGPSVAWRGWRTAGCARSATSVAVVVGRVAEHPLSGPVAHGPRCRSALAGRGQLVRSGQPRPFAVGRRAPGARAWQPLREQATARAGYPAMDLVEAAGTDHQLSDDQGVHRSPSTPTADAIGQYSLRLVMDPSSTPSPRPGSTDPYYRVSATGWRMGSMTSRREYCPIASAVGVLGDRWDPLDHPRADGRCQRLQRDPSRDTPREP